MLVFLQSCGGSGSDLETGEIETTEHGIVYHLKDGWLIEGKKNEDGTNAEKTWLVLIANRDKGTEFELLPGMVKWSSDEPLIAGDETSSSDSEWVATVKGELKESPTEGTRWVSGVNVTEPRNVTRMSVDNAVLASVRKDPSKYSAYELHKLKGPEGEGP